jgi:hypothetical protein
VAGSKPPAAKGSTPAAVIAAIVLGALALGGGAVWWWRRTRRGHRPLRISGRTAGDRAPCSLHRSPTRPTGRPPPP